jgi:hypothetical protein
MDIYTRDHIESELCKLWDCGLISRASYNEVIRLYETLEQTTDKTITNIMCFLCLHWVPEFNWLPDTEYNIFDNDNIDDLLNYELITQEQHSNLRAIEAFILHNGKVLNDEYLRNLERHRFGIVHYCGFDTAIQMEGYLHGG